jgi:hypothetical protein
VQIELIDSWEQMHVEMIASGGPDIFIFNQKIHGNLLDGYRGYIESGAFMDLNELIEKEPANT